LPFRGNLLYFNFYEIFLNMDVDTPEDKDVSSTQDEEVILGNGDVEIIDESDCPETITPVLLPQQPIAPVDYHQPDLVFDALNKKPDDLSSDCACEKVVTPFIGPIRPTEYENETNLNVETINGDSITAENDKFETNLNVETINDDSNSAENDKFETDINVETINHDRISAGNDKFETNSNSSITIVKEISVLNIYQETTEVDNEDEGMKNIVVDNEPAVENMEITHSPSTNNDNGSNNITLAYDFSSFVQIAKVEKPYLSEGNFLKGCKW
jgi:hypothetical protein